MPTPIDNATNPTSDHDAWAQGVLMRQSAMLEQLAEAGLRLAQAIEHGVTEAAPEAPVPSDAAMAFSRVARAVRMTALLQSKLVLDVGRMRSSAVWAADAAREAALTEADEAERRKDPAFGHKARVEAVVARVARAQDDSEERVERLVCETGERLDDEDIYGDVLERPVGELVALICKDLGLRPDWARLAGEAWAAQERDHPRSPFAGMAQSATSPASGRGGPLAERSEKRVVERAGHSQDASPAPILNSA